MSKITDLIAKSWIQDLAEISLLENFFNDPEIVSELQEVEKNRKKRQLALILMIPLVFFLIIYIYSLWNVSIEVWNNSWTYRHSEWFDGIVWSIFACIVVFPIIIKLFHNKIEWAIKKKILSKLSKKIYDNLGYDEYNKYAFNDLQKLVVNKFLNSYEDIDLVEDSIAFTIKNDWKMALVQWYELQTSKTTHDSKWRKQKTTTNHCYLLKIRIPNARIKLEDNMYIKTDQYDWSLKMPIIYAIFWWLLWWVIWVSIQNINTTIWLIITW